MGSVELSKADLAKLLTFVEIAQAFVNMEAPAIRAKIAELLKTPEEGQK